MAGPEGDASTAGNRTLTFDGNAVGDWVESFRSNFRRVENIEQIQCFWSQTAILDGSFPALVHEHDFLIYNEESSRREFADFFLTTLPGFVTDDAKQLTLTGANSFYTDIDFGLCFFRASPKLVTPKELLLHPAGFLRLRFLGTMIPTVTQP